MKKKTYKHLIKTERQEIALYLEEGKSCRRIARLLGRSRNAIRYEIIHNSVRGKYDWKKAQHKAYVKRKYSKYQGMKIVAHPPLWSFVVNKLKEDWSPEEISGRIKYEEKGLPYISAKGIYVFVKSVYGRSVEHFLRYYGKNGKLGGTAKASGLTDRAFIDKRPKIIEKRRRFGDWEGDFIVSGKSGKGVLLVLVERKSRYVVIKRLLTQKCDEVNLLIARILGGFMIFNSLTLDNDIVFQKHKVLSRMLGRPIYFTHPYHSWEKGTVENMNKWIRQYIKKGSDISSYSDEYVQFVQDRLNDRPRKCLKFKTPQEVFQTNVPLKQEISGIIKVIEKQKTPTAAVSYLRG